MANDPWTYTTRWRVRQYELDYNGHVCPTHREPTTLGRPAIAVLNRAFGHGPMTTVATWPPS